MFPPNPAAAGVIITAFAKELARRYQILINIIKDMTMLEPFRRSQVINRSARIFCSAHISAPEPHHRTGLRVP
jgi:hypothetical protein